MHNTSSDVLKETLYKYWSHHSFRPLQENIILDVLNQKDTLAILPTGGGKSICYQLPALILEGTCVVISPLIALINDQIAALKEKGIEAVTIPSKSSNDDIIRLFDNIKVKKTKLLYLSPERLSQPIIQDKLKELTISFVAIDEAHCISQWGHDFRPAYLKIVLLRKLLPNPTFLAVTATATKTTQTQIIDLLSLKDVQKHLGSFNRANLAYQVYETPQKFDLLTRILRKSKTITIVYLQSRLATIELSKRLNRDGFKSTYYHAGLSPKEKENNYNAWNNEQQNIMVATSAFGMGIDKSNVRLVVHLEIPQHIENYTQEAGRAGRDEQKAFSCVILSKNDLLKFEKLRNQNLLTFDDVLTVYDKLNQHFQIAYGEQISEAFDFDLEVFCTKYNLENHKTKRVLQKLNSYGILNHEERYKNSTAVKVICSSKQLLHFCNTQQKYRVLVDYLLRNYVGIFELSKKINLAKLSQTTKMSAIEIHKKLNYLKEIKLIDYDKKLNHNRLKFLVPREDKKTVLLIKKDLLKLNEIEFQKGKKTLAYFENQEVCRNLMILEYFNEQNTNVCGICDICLENKKEVSKEDLSKNTLHLLKKKPHSFNELMIALRINSIRLLEILDYLANENYIQQHQQYYQII